MAQTTEKIAYFDGSFPRTSDGSTNVDMTYPRDPVPSGELITLTSISWEDQTTAFTKARVGITYGGDNNSFFWEELNPEAAQLYWVDQEKVHLRPGTKLIVRFTGTTTGDKLVLSVKGYKQYMEAT